MPCLPVTQPISNPALRRLTMSAELNSDLPPGWLWMVPLALNPLGQSRETNTLVLVPVDCLPRIHRFGEQQIGAPFSTSINNLL